MVNSTSRRKPLDGLLVVALEQAVAAPLASGRLADAGARVIKLERDEGDFARGYDYVVHGESAYFAWLNRGKESIVLDVKRWRMRRCSPAWRRAPTSSSRTWHPAPPTGASVVRRMPSNHVVGTAPRGAFAHGRRSVHRPRGAWDQTASTIFPM